MRTWSSGSRREGYLAIALATALVPLVAWEAHAQVQMPKMGVPPMFVPGDKSISSPLIGKDPGPWEMTIPADVPIVPPPTWGQGGSNSLCDGLTEAQKRLLTICDRK